MAVNSRNIKVRSAKLITNKDDIDYLLNITEDDCMKLSFMMDCFGDFNGKKRFHPYDVLEVPIGSYGSEGHKNKNKFTTTVGLWIFNKGFIEKELFDVFHYVQKTINKKTFKWLHQQITYAVVEDRTTLDVFKNFMNKTQKYLPYVSILAPSESINMITSSEFFDKKKKQIYEKYKEAIEVKHDPLAMHAFEKEMSDLGKEFMKNGDPANDSYNSGARGSMENFQNMYIMRGMFKDPITQEFSMLKSNYMDGVDKDEYPKFANSLAEGPSKRAISTAIGGYWEKLFLVAFGHITIDGVGTDCGTKRYREVVLSDDNKGLWMYSYIVEGNHLTELTSQNLSKYLGKKVKFRFSGLCESKKGICNACAGNLFTRLGITNVGVATPQVASKIKLLNMKGFHAANIKFSEMNPSKAFGF